MRLNAVLCQSVHQETNGKFILVGVVAGALQTNDVVFKDEFSLFLYITDSVLGEHQIRIRLTSPENENSYASVGFSIDPKSIGTLVHVTGIPFETHMSGLFKLDWQVAKSRKWNELTTISIELAENSVAANKLVPSDARTNG